MYQVQLGKLSDRPGIHEGRMVFDDNHWKKKDTLQKINNLVTKLFCCLIILISAYWLPGYMAQHQGKTSTSDILQ